MDYAHVRQVRKRTKGSTYMLTAHDILNSVGVGKDLQSVLWSSPLLHDLEKVEFESVGY